MFKNFKLELYRVEVRKRDNSQGEIRFIYGGKRDILRSAEIAIASYGEEWTIWDIRRIT